MMHDTQQPFLVTKERGRKMIFRNIMMIAFFTAIVSGVFLGIMQSFSTTPLIYAAEVYEVEEAPATISDAHSSDATHGHDNTEWGPANATERVSYTFIADVFIAFGHSLLLTSFMLFIFLKFGKPAISWKSGLIIGLGGYASFYIATVIGLPPEIPGTLAADLHTRQLWWTLTIIATIIGLSTLYFAPKTFKIAGILFIILPHIIGAPHPEAQGFLNQNSSAVTALSQLEHQFLLSTAWVNLLYWLSLGIVSGLLANKFIIISNPR
jgi:cobalt transporter subunit CbtA